MESEGQLDGIASSARHITTLLLLFCSLCAFQGAVTGEGQIPGSTH